MQTTHKQTEPTATSSLAGEHQLFALEPDHLREAWPVIEPLMLQVIEGMNGRQTMPTLLAEIMASELSLWVVVRGEDVRAVVGTQLALASSGLKSCVVRFAVGRGVHEWIGLIEVLEDYARHEGCVRLETWARKGWAKHLPDYKLSHVLLEKDL